MSRVTASLDHVEEGIKLGIVRRHAVNNHVPSTGTQDACGLPDGGVDVDEVVRGDTASDKIERLVIKGQPFRIGDAALKVRHASFDTALTCLVDHACREVGSDHR